MMLFSHGVDSVGLVSIKEWRKLIERAKNRCGFVGVGEGAYPRDFAVFVRYHFDLLRKVQPRYPVAQPLSLQELDAFLREERGDYQVQWLDAE